MEEIVHGNLIFQLPPGARRLPTQGRDIVLHWEQAPLYRASVPHAQGDTRMYRMDGALMMGEQTVKQLIWYVALNSEKSAGRRFYHSSGASASSIARSHSLRSSSIRSRTGVASSA